MARKLVEKNIRRLERNGEEIKITRLGDEMRSVLEDLALE